MIIRIMGDPHGHIDLAEDSYWLSQADLALCTGDFAYHITGQQRQLAKQVMLGLKDNKVYTVLGNHDGVNHRPSSQYGPAEAEPGCQHEMIEALGEFYLGYRRADLENFSVVGGRPFTNGNPGIHHKPFGDEEITVEESAEKILKLIRESPHSDILLLCHNGPKGMGQEMDDICGRDWKKTPADWGDEDLALVMEQLPGGKKIIALIMGHMHHRLWNGGWRRRMDFFKGVPVVNAAVVPRIVKKGLLVSRNYLGEIREKKVFQPHHHFLELEVEDNVLTEVRDLWVCKGNRNSAGTKMLIWREAIHGRR